MQQSTPRTMSIEQLIHEVQLDRVYSTSDNFKLCVTSSADPFALDPLFLIFLVFNHRLFRLAKFKLPVILITSATMRSGVQKSSTIVNV